MFYPGETVIQTFVVPFPEDDIENVIVSYKQKDHIVLEKGVASDNVAPEDDQAEQSLSSVITVELSEKETLIFENDTPFTIQLNIFNLGSRCTSEIMKDYCGTQYLRELSSNIDFENMRRNQTQEDINPEDDQEEVNQDE